MSLLAILNEQEAFGFSGRINVLMRSNNQLIGVVFQYEGKIIGANAGHQKGKKALFYLIFNDVDSTDLYKLVVEPEVISPICFMFELTFSEVKFLAEKQFPEYLQAKKLKPPTHLKLLINPDIIFNSNDVTPEEFAVLSVLSEFSTVQEVYQSSNLLEFEITNALVSLRKKKAIKVLNN
jgi:hypothetical protein